MKKRRLNVAMWIPGVAFMTLGISIVVWLSVLAWLVAIACILAGGATLAMANFMHKIGARLGRASGKPT